MRDMDRVPSAYIHAAEKLVENGYVMVPLKIQTLVFGVMRCYRKFLEEPKVYRESYNFWTSGEYGPNKKDLGYCEKNGDNPGEDAKDIFHWGDELEPYLHAKSVDTIRHQFLLGYSREIFEISWQHHCMMLEACDYVIPGFNLYERTQGGLSRKPSRLRLVSYKERPGRKVMAEGHFDLGVVTSHLYSGPGLWLVKDNTRIAYTHSPGYILMFFGKEMEEITKGELKAVWHEVTDERAAADTRRREAAVFFGRALV